MTMQDLRTLRALVNDEIEYFKIHRPPKTEDELDEICYKISKLQWFLFKRDSIQEAGFRRLIENTVRKAFSI